MSPRPVLRAILVGTVGLLGGCSQAPAKIVADAPLDVLERPAPPDYPSTAPLPNGVLHRAAAGEQLDVVEKAYEKDFMYYRVKLADGRTGYVIARAGALHEVRQ
jgi:hypothetical protein